MRRRQLRSLKKSKKDKLTKGQKSGYKTGSFGLSDRPEDITVPKKSKRQKVQS